ncbi:response regulator [Pseudoxanthomonas sp. 10H]|uniref:response regulator n=1 Tax=Pseudoxanthomonas sp. 10H TaxID=3242729 RepID=UPI0035563035
MKRPLAGVRVLVLEDNDILAGALAECLEDAGAEVLGPCSTATGALAVLHDAGPFDLAVLDVRLEHGTSEAVAAAAREKGAAVMLMTGFDEGTLPDSMKGLSVCAKPFDTRTLIRALQRLRDGSVTADPTSA